MEELVEKATFYLENEQECLAMTQRAAAKTETGLSANAFWTAVFARANLAGFTGSSKASP